MMRTKSTMSYKTWDIILVPFPFTNLRQVKKRPALILSPPTFNSGRNLVILFITSNIGSPKRTGDHQIKKWKEAGLPKPSLTRMKFATIEKSIIIKKLGTLQSSDQHALQKKLASFFGLS